MAEFFVGNLMVSETGVGVFVLRGLDSNQRPPGYAYCYDFRHPKQNMDVFGLQSGLSLHPNIIQDACHLVSTPFRQLADLARDYHIKGFPEFDK